MVFSQRALLIYPATGLSSAMQDAAAQAFVTHLGLETFANERLMFSKAAASSSDYGATETHRVISSAMTPALASALKTALAGMSGNWYLVDAASGALLDTNDTVKKPGAKVTKGLDWQPGAAYAANEVVQYNGALYQVLAPGHTSQADWPPEVAASLFKRYSAPGEVSEFRQPLGAHDAYPLGARVTHDKKTWISLVANNVWQPGAVGVTQWKEDSGKPAPGEWAVGVAYKTGDVVTYGGQQYSCVQGHTSQAGWTPDVVPALWKPL